MKTRRLGLLVFIAGGMMLLVWLMVAPNISAHATNLLSFASPALDSHTHPARNSQATRLVYTADITFTPAFTTYLPLISRPIASISGQITYQGVPIDGITVSLFRGPDSIHLLTTTTQANGVYQFLGVPDSGLSYYEVLYENSSNSAYAANCIGPALYYSASTSALGGNFEIGDIKLVSPANGATVALPVTFQWTRRVAQSDNYRLDIVGPPSYYWVYDFLGYVGQYTVQSLAGGPFTAGTPYKWLVTAHLIDGSTCSSFEPHTVIFSNIAFGFSASRTSGYTLLP